MAQFSKGLLKQFQQLVGAYKISAKQKVVEIRNLQFENYYVASTAEILKDAHANLFGDFSHWHRDPYFCHRFIDINSTTEKDLSAWTIVDDSSDGGTSTSKISLKTIDNSDQKCKILVWEGELCDIKIKEQPSFWQSEDEVMTHTKEGYAALVSPENLPPLNLSMADLIVAKMTTGNREYYLNVYPEFGWVQLKDDIYQALIDPDEPRPLHEKRLDWDALLQVKDGQLRASQMPIRDNRIKSMGFALSGPAGPFRLELEYIELRNNNYQEKKNPKKSQKQTEGNIPPLSEIIPPELRGRKLSRKKLLEQEEQKEQELLKMDDISFSELRRHLDKERSKDTSMKKGDKKQTSWWDE